MLCIRVPPVLGNERGTLQLQCPHIQTGDVSVGLNVANTILKTSIQPSSVWFDQSLVCPPSLVLLFWICGKHMFVQLQTNQICFADQRSSVL